jgi:hypothetical protein
MSSDIDTTFPADNVKVSKATMRAQYSTIKDEIEALQSKTGVPGLEAFRSGLTYREVERLITKTVPAAMLTATYGDIYVTGGVTAQSSIGTGYVEVTGFAANGQSSSNVTPDHTSEDITVTDAGIYHVGFHMNFSGSASTQFTFSIHVGGAEPTEVIAAIRTIGAGADSGSCGNSGFLSLAASDVISLYVKADGASKSITPEESRLWLRRVG